MLMEKTIIKLVLDDPVKNNNKPSIAIKTAIYFIIIGKNNGNINLEIHTTDDIEIENRNKIISYYVCVDKVNAFADFLRKHPIFLAAKQDTDSYIFSAEIYKKVISLCKKQHKFYINRVAGAAGAGAGGLTEDPVKVTESTYENECCDCCDNNNEKNCRETFVGVAECVPKQININRGNKIQKYSIEGELLKTYIGIRDATRDASISDTTLKSAIINKTIYAGHRWLYLDRGMDDATVQDIGESVKVNTPKNAFVAMLDIDKTRIVSVFQNQKEASIARKLKSSSAIYQSITRGNLSSGHYFKYYDDCSDDMKTAFINSGGIMPSPHVNKGVGVKQIDYMTGEVIKEYPSILDVQKTFQISSKCIKKAIATGEVIKGFKWEF